MPTVTVIGGPNGAGKTTGVAQLLPDFLKNAEFINADEIAAQMDPKDPESKAFEAGRLMLRRMNELLEARMDLAFETTMASKSFATFLRKCREAGYETNSFYFWLESPDMAIRRVAQRVREGGHNIPEDVIRRRYEGGIRNFINLYIPVCDHWKCYDNSKWIPIDIASGVHGFANTRVYDPVIWNRMIEVAQGVE